MSLGVSNYIQTQNSGLELPFSVKYVAYEV